MIVYKGDDSAAGPDSAYAPGNEERTNPSILSLVPKGGLLKRLQDIDGQCVRDWSIRVFESKNPIVSTNIHNRYNAKPFYSEPAYGYHFVVVASPNKDDTLATIDAEQWSNVLLVVQDRIKWLYTQTGVTYVAVYADYGELTGNAGAHPHLNVVSFKTIPPIIESEMDFHHKILLESDSCPICQTVEKEISGPRQILQTESFIAYCPWSSSYPFEFWITTKRHTVSFTKITQMEINDLAQILRATLGGLSKVANGASYSLVFHLSAEKKTSRPIHWHVEVYPITKHWSGMERGYGIHLNDVSPEEAAKRLGLECRKEFARMHGIL